MATPPPNLTPEQHRACAQRLAVLEGWTRRTWAELAAVYGASSLVARAAEAACGALGNLREACQYQARHDWPGQPEVATQYRPPQGGAEGG